MIFLLISYFKIININNKIISEDNKKNIQFVFSNLWSCNLEVEFKLKFLQSSSNLIHKTHRDYITHTLQNKFKYWVKSKD